MSNSTLTQAIDTVASGEDLTRAGAEAVRAEIMAGEASEVEISALLIGLRAKGETVDELAGLASTMRSLATPVNCDRDDLLDTAGTGGGQPTFNVSTTAALIAAGAGCAVAKHGNRSATSRSGSADVLEALGARIDLDPAAVAACIAEAGFGFMFAPNHHQATRFVVPVRKELAVRTIFNFLGPLTNPAGARRQVIGVSDPAFVDRIAGAAGQLGVERALVVSGAGIDELSTVGTTHVVEVRGSANGAAPAIESYDLEPEDVGLARVSFAELTGGEPAENARITRDVLAGQAGAPRDIAVLNAGAAIYAAGRAETLQDGVGAAQEAIDSHAAAAALERFVEATRRLAPA